MLLDFGLPTRSRKSPLSPEHGGNAPAHVVSMSLEIAGKLGQADVISAIAASHDFFLTFLLADGGLVYSFLEATIEGKIVLLVLFLGSIFSWSVMVTKIRYLNFAKRQSERFSALFRRDRAPLRIYEQGIRFEGSPLYEIYKAGCVELCFQLLGSSRS